MRKEVIDGGQLISIMFWTIMGTAVLTLPVLIGRHAPRDAWIAAVIFIIGGLGLSLVIGALAKKFPEKDFVSCVENVFGIWIGKILIAIFFIWLLHTTSFVIWQISTFTKISLLPRTPLLIVVLIIIIPSVYAVHNGIESVARSGQFIFLITFGTLFVLFLMNMPEVNIENLQPVFDDGFNNIIRSSLAPLAWAGEIMFILFLVPNVKQQKKITQYSMITIILIGIGGIINEFFYTAVFGPLRQHLISPFYTLVRYISPSDFIGRYDVLFVSVNLAGNFVKLSVFMYILIFSFSKLFKKQNHRPFVLPVTIALIILTLISVEGSPQLTNFLDNVFPFYTLPILYGLPSVTLLVAKLRKLK
ncbi:GerAB/ArcD/ProY family transporter [Alkaliphilus pronyensis]|uniref:GerAB/ArcD/ProY family transporter n=1 Tax=Alkaliphilus pronyensis TaxID=1482732 RepID=A0A6I0F8L9_9FIRM|nr:endospore germination permease [Alkaliphilus pronyensis]KAB3534853.1 GerAB/ArcD/ProY family transporter [Alkaliphilus pronyensis]